MQLKVAERLILKDITPHLVRSTDTLQFAYKRNRSTLDAAVTLSHNITSSIDLGSKSYLATFLVFSSEFNTISRDKIINKLTELGASQWSLIWLRDYFSNRFQFIALSGKTSSLALNSWDVLQGAVLSPFLFNLYTDEIRTSTNTLMIKYADVIALGQKFNLQNDHMTLQLALNDIAKWSETNYLSLNTDKCNLCIFTVNQKCLDLQQHTTLNDHNLNIVKDVKYLGVTFSSNLTWSSHIEYLYKKCLRLSFYIRRLITSKVPRSVIKKFVDSCVLPIILYASPITMPGLLKKDITLLRRAIKLITKPSGIDYNVTCGIIIDRHISECMNFCYRILNDSNHPLHIALNNTRSYGNTRRNFTHVFARTTMFYRSPIPYLARLLSDPEIEKGRLILSQMDY